ncbi:SDR family NAD(P)-dependent oxidoreductase [Ahrensia sp. R2A130]|uniref:SDR family NAD(P)-dependent oxidoreductase n=1 Tax=Ahrensia sp. R2A130 TaxID=744979 RepID=UPI0001E09C21|nr:SDR family NAD(P)-dependent oxidoreductase [Ahrensia sp. R2A130]EFL90624.1 NAD/nadp dependent oxidoreductase [Ahrensia sp. R2A130]
MSEKPLEGRVALVTGASRGIGYEAALGLARAGAHVIAVARTVGGLEDLDDAIRKDGGTATLVPLDLTDFDAIDRLGGSINERWGKLDILVGNAGALGVLTPLAQNKPAVFEQVFALNVTANYRLIRSLDPLLQKSDAGRAIFLTSGAARNSKAFVGPYSASKAALEALVRSYAAENRLNALNTNLLDPGHLRTKMRAQYAPGEDPKTVTEASAIIPAVLELASEDCDTNGGVYSLSKQGFLTESA